MVDASKEKVKDNHLQNLLYGEGAAIKASLLTGVKYNTEVLPYREWGDGFTERFNGMRLNDELMIADYQAAFDSLSASYDSAVEAVLNSSGYDSLENYVREQGVERRWDYERFFAGASSEETAAKVLGAYQSDGNFRNWTTEELEILVEGNRLSAPLEEILGQARETVEVHHGRAISLIREKEFGNMRALYDPENGDLFTPRAHLELAHGGNFQNQTDEQFTAVTERFDAIRREERYYFDSREHYDDIIGITLGVAAGSISAVIRYRKLSADSAPWSRRKLLSVTGAFFSGGLIGMVPYLMIQQMHNPTRHFIEDTMLQSFGAQHDLFNSIADASGSFILILSAISARLLLQAGFQVKKVGMKSAMDSISPHMKKMTVEQTGFFILQIGLDNLTPIPDPVISPLITGLRISYSVGKIFLSREKKEKLLQKRLDYLHDAAYSALV